MIFPRIEVLMEGLGPLVLEISSDEEDGFRKGSGFDGGEGEDCNWLSNLLHEVGGNADDDSDDVVVVSEVFPKAPKKPRSGSVIVDVKSDDDDCVILDCDPEKPVVNRRVEDDGNSDDLEIVGEKGDVACRDFPHPRHLCAKFLFGSTPHEVHCEQCHCYVCDSLAPCSEWSSDHCHASDKDEFWKAERKRVKKAVSPSPIGTTCRIESFFPPARPPPQYQVGFNRRRVSSNIGVLKQVPLRPSVPHFGSRNHQSVPVLQRHNFLGDSQNNRGPGNPSLKRRLGSMQQMIGTQNADSVMAQAPRMPSLHSVKLRGATFQPGIRSRPYGHTKFQSQTYANQGLLSSAILSHPRVESINNLVLPRPQPNNLAPSPSYQSGAGSVFVNQLHSRSMVSSNHASQPQQQIYNPTTSILVDGQNDVQQIQNGTDASLKDFRVFPDLPLDNGNVDLPLDNGNVQIHSQHQSTEPAETSQFQSEPKSDHHLSTGSFSQQSVVLADFTSPVPDVHTQFLESGGPDPLDFQFDNWMFDIDNQPLSTNWNVFSPEPAFIDTGTLFDI